jgi:MFS transporter, putative metabolite:H+ symporter
MSDESGTATVDNLVARLNRIPLTRTGVKVLILLQIAWIIEGIDIGVSGPVLLLLKDIWHLNPQELGILGASGTLGIVLGLIPAGYLADRFGRKPLAVWGMLQFTFFTGLEALAPNYSWFLVLRFLDGIGQGVLFAVPYLMISEFLRPARRATAVGFENGILEMAYVIPALLGAWAVSHFAPESAWRLILLISTSTIIYVPVLARWLPESPRWLLKHGKIEQARKLIERLEREANLGADLSLSTGAAAIIADDKTPSVREYFTRPFLGRSFVTYTAYTAGLMMWYGMLTYGPIIFRGVGFTSTNAILMLGFMMFVGSLGNFWTAFWPITWDANPFSAFTHMWEQWQPWFSPLAMDQRQSSLLELPLHSSAWADFLHRRSILPSNIRRGCGASAPRLAKGSVVSSAGCSQRTIFRLFSPWAGHRRFSCSFRARQHCSCCPLSYSVARQPGST